MHGTWTKDELKFETYACALTNTNTSMNSNIDHAKTHNLSRVPPGAPAGRLGNTLRRFIMKQSNETPDFML